MYETEHLHLAHVKEDPSLKYPGGQGMHALEPVTAPVFAGHVALHAPCAPIADTLPVQGGIVGIHRKSK